MVTGCGTAKLSTAEAQRDRGEFFAAANTYRRVYNKTSVKEKELRADIAAKMGYCYQRINMTARAAGAYQNAIRYKHPDSTLILNLARMQHNDAKYRDAQKNYEAYLALDNNNLLAKNGIKGVALAQEWRANKTRVNVKRMDLFNSRRADFSPALNKDGDVIYFTSSSEKNKVADKSEVTGLKFNDIWYSKKDENGIWLKPEVVEAINTDFDEGTPALSADGNTMYFTRARRDAVYATSTEIFVAQRSGGQWGEARKLEITKDTLSVFAHPAPSPDGKWLYFVSDMPGGQGGKDLWRAPIEGMDIGAVENLGDQLNTPGDEMFPTFHPDGTLYFSSNGHPGMGGLDIFSAREDEWGTWHIDNMKAPVNSQADDFGMTFFNTGKDELQGFFSSNRGDARGYDHIYSFHLPSIKVRVTGYVTDRDEEPIPNAIVRVVGRDGSNYKIITKPDGTFEAKINKDVEYVMMAGAQGYLNAKEEFHSDNEDMDATYDVMFTLAPINRPVLIDNIFYDFDRATLKPESATALNELITLLNDNPNVSIELSAHTDMIGTDTYNENLSGRRAQSVVDYLIKGGIEKERLQAKGYGKGAPKVVSEKLDRKSVV